MGTSSAAWALGVGLAVVGPTSAASFPDEIVTVEQARREAVDRHPDVVAARAALLSAEAGERSARGNYFPTLSAEADYSRSGERLLSSPGSDAYGLGASAKQNIFDGLKSVAAVHLRQAQRESAVADLESTMSRVGAEATSAHADLLFAQQNVDLSRQILLRRKGNSALIELRYQGGREHKGSLLRIKAAERGAAFDVSQAERERSVAQVRLARLMGRDLQSPLTAQGGFEVSLSTSDPKFDLLAKDTPDVRAAQARQRAASARRTLARGDFFPVLDATLSHRWTDDRWPPGSRRWQGGLSLSIPVFSGGATLQDVRAAEADLDRAGAQARSAYGQSFLDLTSAWADVRDAVERVEVQKGFLESASVRALIARGQYTSGLLRFEDWDLIENDLIQSQKQYLSDQRNAVRADAEWKKVQGAVP